MYAIIVNPFDDLATYIYPGQLHHPLNIKSLKSINFCLKNVNPLYVTPRPQPPPLYAILPTSDVLNDEILKNCTKNVKLSEHKNYIETF